MVKSDTVITVLSVSLCLQKVLRSLVKGKILEMVCMALSITPLHLEHTPSLSPGVDSTSPEGKQSYRHKCYNEIPLTCHCACNGDCDSACSVPLRSRLVLRPASRRWGPGVQGWRLASLENLLTLLWRLLETTSGHWVRMPETQQITWENIPEVNTVVGIQSFSNLLHLFFPGQVFQWKVLLRPKLNVTTRAMDPVMCATGPQSLGSMLYMCSATMKTSSTLPLWLRSSTHQAKTSTPTRYAPN